MPEAAEPDKTSTEEENFAYGRGKNWTEENIHTLISWLHTSAVMLDLTREATTYYRKLMRRSTIINLIFSSVAGTVSLSQFNGSTSYSAIETLLKAFFSASSILVALNTGYIKVYQIQERLESTIQLQQQWSNFGSFITSELQLPKTLRKDALQVINKMKETYHQLIRDHVDINREIMEKVALQNGISPQQLTISDLFERVISEEWNRIKAENGENDNIINVSVDTDDEDDATVAPKKGAEPPSIKTVKEGTNEPPSTMRTLQRSSTHLFENKNTKKLRSLDKKVINTRTQIANIVLNPRRATSSKSTNDGKQTTKDGVLPYQVVVAKATAGACASASNSINSEDDMSEDLEFSYDNEGNPELGPVSPPQKLKTPAEPPKSMLRSLIPFL